MNVFIAAAWPIQRRQSFRGAFFDRKAKQFLMDYENKSQARYPNDLAT